MTRLALALAILCASALPAWGQQACDERSKVIDHLTRKYQETVVGVAITTAGGLIEILTTKDGDTWTIVLTTPQGMSCLVAEGENWEWILKSVKDGPAV